MLPNAVDEVRKRLVTRSGPVCRPIFISCATERHVVLSFDHSADLLAHVLVVVRRFDNAVDGIEQVRANPMFGDFAYRSNNSNISDSPSPASARNRLTHPIASALEA